MPPPTTRIHQEIRAKQAADELESQRIRKRVRELLAADPSAVFAMIRSQGTNNSATVNSRSAEPLPLKRVTPCEVLSESDVRNCHAFVSSSGRCRRECPEMYSFFLERAAIVRGEEAPANDAK